jgi:hypothetical protein
MQVFLAMTPDTEAAVEETKKLSVTSLGLPPHVRYVPLKDTKEHALDAAVKAKGMDLPGMARTWTKWSVIELWVPESTAFEMVSAGNLQRDLSANGWKLFAELDYTDFSATWEPVHSPPMGTAAWTQLNLMPSFRTLPNEQCIRIRCNKRGAVWRGYCGDCWLDYLQENQCD